MLNMLRSQVLLAIFVLAAAAPFAPTAGASGTCPSFASASDGLPQSWEWRTHPALADINGDGHLDLAANPRKGRGPSLFLGDGRGHWRQAGAGLALPGLACGVGVALDDVNGDGRPDLAVADHCHGLFVFLNGGNEPWRLSWRARRVGRAGHEDVTLGDLDGDGHTDVVSVGSFHGGIMAFAGDGSGRFSPMDVGLPGEGMARDVKLADVNGDGRLDVLATFTADLASEVDYDESNRLVWLSGPDGRYRPANRGIPGDRQYRMLAVGDVNGDGHPDLAASAVGYHEDRGPLHVYLGDGAGSWTPSMKGLPAPQPGLSFSGVELADLDRDGNLDLVATTWLDAGIRVWMGDGSGAWRECTDTGLPSGREELRGWGVTVGDVDGDGRPDIAAGFGRRGAGSLEVWRQRR